jgi:CDP-paratose 2-epimerase
VRQVIIGGAGFIGSNLAARFATDGDEVLVADNLSRAGAFENADWLRREHPAIELVPLDIRTDSERLADLVSEADAVYHLAAQVAVTTSVRDPRLDFSINALGTLNVLEAVRTTGVKAPLLYSSTNKVYGGLEHVPLGEDETRYRFADGRDGIDENVPLDLHSPYGCSKGAGDQYVRDYARIYGLRTVVLRQSCIFGPRQFGIEDQGWLAWFAIAGVLGRPITLYGNGKQVRDLLHVQDLIDLMTVLVESADEVAGEIFNVGGGPANAVSLLEALELLEQLLGETIEKSFADSRPGDQRVYVSDIGKLERSLGWSPSYTVPEGVRDLVSWIRANAGLFDQMPPTASIA